MSLYSHHLYTVLNQTTFNSHIILDRILLKHMLGQNKGQTNQFTSVLTYLILHQDKNNLQLQIPHQFEDFKLPVKPCFNAYVGVTLSSQSKQLK